MFLDKKKEKAAANNVNKDSSDKIDVKIDIELSNMINQQDKTVSDKCKEMGVGVGILPAVSAKGFNCKVDSNSMRALLICAMNNYNIFLGTKTSGMMD